MKDQDNKEYIKSLFEDDGIKAPESLSEEKMLALIEADEKERTAEKRGDNSSNKHASEFESAASSRSDEYSSKHAAGARVAGSTHSNARKPMRPRVMRWVALAACAVIAVAGLPSLYYSDLFMPDTSVKGGELHTFKSKSEIARLVKSFNRSSPLDFFRLKSQNVVYDTEDIASNDMDMELSSEPKAFGTSESSEMARPGASDSANTTGSAGAGADHSSTYLQVEEVDEADIVKVDGRYIYAVNNKREVIIYEAVDGKVKKVSTIGSEGIELYVQNIFLKGDTLVTIGKVYNDDNESYNAVVSYDIKDRSKPRKIKEFRQSGEYIISSRMVGDYVYIVTSYHAFGGFIMPKCTNDKGEFTEMDYADISCVPKPDTPSYIVLSAVDISSGDQNRSKTKAVLGVSETIYCNDHNLYLSASDWSGVNDGSQTRIIRAALDGLDINFDGTTTVRGYINNQFSMDEHNGYFRIATTSERGDIEVNNLFVLDKKLNEVGKISGFARDESIKAVRFMGDRAYVITYEAIDPLFIMDLSDPANPRIDGEVKIDGFSSLLVPAGGDRLLGIGYATGDNGYGGQFEAGLKLALFDISNPSEPKVLDSKEFKDMESPAQSSHLALTVNSKAGYYAIPYNIWNYGEMIIEDDFGIIDDAETAEEDTTTEEDGGGDDSPDALTDEPAASTLEDTTAAPENETGVLVFGIGGDKKDKIEVYDKHKLDAVQILRSPYIGDYIYGITGEAEVESFRFTK